MRNTKNSAFTLVELIVVITILAILGTIAFISLQGYSGDSRDSKRVSDIASIAKKVSIKVIEKSPTTLDKFLDSADAAKTFDSITIGSGSTQASGSTVYSAGAINFTSLAESGDDFSGPTDNEEYVYAFVSTGSVKAFQVAAKLEDDTARISGNYFKAADGDNDGLIKEVGNSTGTGGVTNGGTKAPY